MAGPVHSFQIAGEGLYTDLTALGLTPRKSRTLAFPEVPEACLRHFIRGCWDGDGSVYLSGATLCASIVSGSREFMQCLVARLVGAGFSERTIYQHASTPGRDSFMIRLRGHEAVRFCHFLYDDVPSGQYLSRKFSVFHRFKNAEAG